jgi:hypothetical protein
MGCEASGEVKANIVLDEELENEHNFVKINKSG